MELIEELIESRNMNGTKVALINRVLPAETLSMILALLLPRDLKAAVLVCRRWREVGESPVLWTWVHLRVGAFDHQEVDLKRLQRLRHVVLDWGRWNPGGVPVKSNRSRHNLLIQTIGRHPTISFLKVRYQTDLGLVEPEIFRSLLIKLEQIVMLGLNLEPEQGDILFSTILDNTKLKRLHIVNNNLSSADPQLLARAVSNIEDVQLENTEVTTEQATKMVKALATDQSKTKVLNLANNNLASVDPQLMTEGIKQLKGVNLFKTHLSYDFIIAICASLQETNLEKVDLRQNGSFGEVEAKILNRWQKLFTGWLGIGEEDDPADPWINILANIAMEWNGKENAISIAIVNA